MPQNNPKILLVEDEPDVCSSIQSYLGRRGFMISTTASGKDALSLIPISRPDIVILDFTLEELDGREVLKSLRAADQETKVIVITGQLLPPEDVDKIIALGVSGYFHKPVSLEQLAGVINKILGREDSYPATKMKSRITKTLDTSVAHKLSNLLGIIRNRCENFTLNIKDGIYNDKSPEELVEVSVDIMNDVMEKVDEAVKVVEKIKEE